MDFGMLLGIVGIIGFLGCLIWLIIRAIQWDSKWPPVLGMVLCVVLFFAGVAVSGPSDSKGDEAPQEPQAQKNNGEEKPPEKESAQQPSSAGTGSTEEDQNSVGLDGAIAGDFFSISIVDVKWADALELDGGGTSITATPQNEGAKLLCLIFSAKNMVEETKNLGMFNAYVDKQAVLPTTFLAKFDDAMVFGGAVASGMEMKTYQIWELPEDWEEFQLNYFEATGPECQQYFVIHREDIE